MEKMPRLVPPSLQAFTSFPFHWKKASPCPLLRKKITKTYLQVHKPPSKPCDSQAPNNIRWWSFSWPQVFYDFFSDEYRDGGRDVGLLHMPFPLSLIQSRCPVSALDVIFRKYTDIFAFRKPSLLTNRRLNISGILPLITFSRCMFGVSTGILRMSVRRNQPRIQAQESAYSLSKWISPYWSLECVGESRTLGEWEPMKRDKSFMIGEGG